MSLSWSLGSWLPVLRRLPPSATADAVGLTIDDAPNPDTTPGLLELLDRYDAQATFFLSGCRAEPHFELAAEIVRRGHAVYAHGWEHIRLDKAGTERLIADMARCEALLARLRPTPSPYLVRLPQNGGYRNAKVHRALARWMPGCQFAHWGVSTEDHLTSTRCESAEDVARECRRDADRVLVRPDLPGAIVLLHDQPINERPGSQFKPAVTLTLAELLLQGLAERNLRSLALQPAPNQPWWSRFMLI